LPLCKIAAANRLTAVRQARLLFKNLNVSITFIFKHNLPPLANAKKKASF